MLPFKACCILSTEEIDRAVTAGARAVGLVGKMPNGPGQLNDNQIKAFATHTANKYQDQIWSVLLTSRTNAPAIINHAKETGVNTIQIVDQPEAGAHHQIRAALPHIRIIQVIHVQGRGAIRQAQSITDDVDYILLDSGGAVVDGARTLGGTGTTHDWSISQEIVEAVETPVFLAGGLTPENVRDAIERVKPFGVDICSGIRDRSNGYMLDTEKLAQFAKTLGAAPTNNNNATR